MSKEFELYHRLALSKLIHFNKLVSIKLYPTQSNSSYILDDGIGLFIKYSTKRMSPWRFSFLKEHQDEIEIMKSGLDKVFILLVCGVDGIVCLEYGELKKILDENHEMVEWISASRKPREQYVIKGTDGKLKFRVGQGDFPAKIFN